MKRIMLTAAFVLGVVGGCVDGSIDMDDEFEEFRAGGFFCCDASGENCVLTTSGACPPGDDLWYCPVIKKDPAGLWICDDWEG